MRDTSCSFGVLKYHHCLYVRNSVCKSDMSYMSYYLRENYIDLGDKLYFRSRFALTDAFSRVNPQEKMEMKGLDITIQDISILDTSVDIYGV